MYADPPWQLGNPDGPYAPENHYPTLLLAEIKALAVPAAEDALLFLWAVNCLLPQALEVMEAWGFIYVTNLVWVKPSIGLGRWVRNRHELLLVGRKGDFPAPELEDLPDSVIEAARGRHSEKPACVREAIERMYPHASKVELFARGAAPPGGFFWGNEAEGSGPSEAGSRFALSTISGTRHLLMKPLPETRRWRTSSSRQDTHRGRSPSATTSMPHKCSFRARQREARAGCLAQLTDSGGCSVSATNDFPGSRHRTRARGVTLPSETVAVFQGH